MAVWVCSCPVGVEGLFSRLPFGFLSLKFGYNSFSKRRLNPPPPGRLKTSLSSRPRSDHQLNISPTQGRNMVKEFILKASIYNLFTSMNP
jgi:hypothetical protein